MNNSNLTIEELKVIYNELDPKGRSYLDKVEQENDHTLNALATIDMDGVTPAKRPIAERIGIVGCGGRR